VAARRSGDDVRAAPAIIARADRVSRDVFQ
jgi:hypothetical protein